MTGLEATRYDDGTIAIPSHPVGPDGGAPVETIDLSEYEATVITWTTATATPPGVRAPNHLAIVEFEIDGESARMIGQLTTDEIEIGATVRPVYVSQLRDPEAGIRDPESQSWDGYRFEPVE
ncbi:OB-fold domain-containing protein [Halocatena halophila]|uniref:OB-fold domain-containing protein n=1 Tax=Halocatena halophila TaxID=2814576 RepID=UPI002ED2B060